MGYEPTWKLARSLDAADGLAGFRRQFEIPKDRRGRSLTYLAGHSLGLLPRGARRVVKAELDQWGQRGVEGHFHGPRPWYDYHEQFAQPLGRLIGAAAREVVAMNTLTVNLHLMMVSFYRPRARRYKILIEKSAFPSDRYAVLSQLNFHGIDAADGLLELDTDGSLADDLAEILAREGDRIALILLPGVQYLTGEVIDMARVCRLGRAHDCRVGFDLAHAIGNVPMQLSRWGADFAVWCSYKYLNGGPGAVGGAFVHRRWTDAAVPRFAGWWGHDKAQRFTAAPAFRPLPGAEGWQLSNPPILSLAPLVASLRLFERAGLAQLRAKSRQLTRFLELSLKAELGGRVQILTPRAAARRGCQLSISLQLGDLPGELLLERLHQRGLVADWRAPNVLRLAPVPLYNRFVEVFRAARALKQALLA